MNLVDILNEHANFRSEQIALKDCRFGKDRAITFGNLHRHVGLAAEKLLSAGIKKNHRVLIAVSLSIETYVILLALFRVGAIAVVADASMGFKTLEQSVYLVKPDAVIFDEQTRFLCMLSAHVRNIRVQLSSNRVVSNVERLPQVAGSQSNSAENVEREHAALITFTSGSTGQPKAIVRTHGFLQHQQVVIANSLPPQSEDIELTTLPVFVLSALSHGITAVLPDCNMRKPASIDAARIAAQIDRCDINRIIASPAFLQRLSDYLAMKQILVRAVRKIYTGGGPVFPALLKQMKIVFPNAELCAVYGSTEAEPIAHIDFESITEGDLARTFAGGGLLAGKPIQDIEMRIADPTLLNKSSRDGAAKNIPALPPYAIGEIVVSGNHVVKTYLGGLGNAETKIEVHSDAGKKVWHRTGDAGYLDGKGRLWLMGRSSSKLEDGRGEVYPFQVEAAASEVDSIKRATCLKSNGKRILLIERKKQSWLNEIAFMTPNARAKFLDNIRETFDWLQFDELRLVRKIPMDKRHNAKIQYSQVEYRLNHSFPWSWGRIIHHPV